MQDKTFELMEKMYTELVGFQKEMNDFRQQTEKRFDGIENDIKGVKKDVQQLGAKIDGDLTERIRSLYDARSLTHDKIDQLQIDINNLAAKSLNNDSRIIEISRDLKKVK